MAERHDAHPRSLLKAKRKHVAKSRGRGSGLTRKVQSAIDAVVFGDAENLKQAAATAGLTERALYAALAKPAVIAYFKSQVELLRGGEKATNLRKLIEVRDDPALRESAAGNKVVIEAVKTIEAEPGEQSGGVNVNVGVAVQQNMPGYQIDFGSCPEDVQEVARILRASGSTRNLLQDEIDRRQPVIDAERN